jgi:hypothetical protein
VKINRELARRPLHRADAMMRMSDPDRPHFDLSLEAHIEEAQSRADEMLWGRLEQSLVPTPVKEKMLRVAYPGLHGPPTPKKPMLLRTVFANYARTLYIAEGHHYPQDPRLEIWLQKLAERIVDRAMSVVGSVQESARGRGEGLEYHGLTSTQMRESAFGELNKLISSRLNPKPVPSPPPPPLEVRRQMDYTASGVDITSQLASTEMVRPVQYANMNVLLVPRGVQK